MNILLYLGRSGEKGPIPPKKGIQFIFLGNRKMGNLHNNNRWDLFLGVLNNFVKKVFWGLVSWKTFIIYFVSVGSRFRLAEDQRHSFSGSQPQNESDTRCMFTNISNIKDYNMSYGLWVPQRRCFWLCRIMTWYTGTFWPGRSCIHYVGGKPRVESVIDGNEGKGTKIYSLRPAGITLWFCWATTAITTSAHSLWIIVESALLWQ